MNYVEVYEFQNKIMINWMHCSCDVWVDCVIFVHSREPRNISDAKITISYMNFCSLQMIGTAKGINVREPFNLFLNHITQVSN